MKQPPIASHEHRPLARTVIRLYNAGMPIADIAWRLRRSPGHINRILHWTKLPRPPESPQHASASTRSPSILRPVERMVIDAREAGIDRTETAARLRRSPQHIAKIETYADSKLARLS